MDARSNFSGRKRTVDVVLVPSEIPSVDMKGETAVVIDVLRATTTICAALQNGAGAIVAVREPGEALELAKQLGTGRDGNGEGSGSPEVLLGGERRSMRIEGFDLGNSPLEYSRDRVSGKTIVITTTNGTAAIESSSRADTTVICAFVNAPAVVNYLGDGPENDVVLVCAGLRGRFSLEDTCCAGYVVERLTADFGFSMTDSAGVARFIFQRHSCDILGMLRETQHGKNLLELGFGPDLDFASRLGSIPAVPVVDPAGFIRKVG